MKQQVAKAARCRVTTRHKPSELTAYRYLLDRAHKTIQPEIFRKQKNPSPVPEDQCIPILCRLEIIKPRYACLAIGEQYFTPNQLNYIIANFYSLRVCRHIPFFQYQRQVNDETEQTDYYQGHLRSPHCTEGSGPQRSKYSDKPEQTHSHCTPERSDNKIISLDFNSLNEQPLIQSINTEIDALQGNARKQS